MSSFSAAAWARNQARYETIRAMPFNAELAAGILTRDRFQHYIVQDAHYLVGFGRALAIAAAKAPHPDRVVQFARAAEAAIVVERSLHAGFMRDFGIAADTFAATEITPACQHYVSYLIATSYGEDHAVGLAALLPCFWIYAEIGRDIYARAAKPNPYQAWIDTYAGDDFHEAVARMMEATDEAAATASPMTVGRMHEAFTSATRLEYLFWQSAYDLARWRL
ncbi:MAG: thiaminase II [Alphaproteobacteria bacterium]|nr:thiaminase II [Alphaproteobacteria bacterium]